MTIYRVHSRYSSAKANKEQFLNKNGQAVGESPAMTLAGKTHKLVADIMKQLEAAARSLASLGQARPVSCQGSGAFEKEQLNELQDLLSLRAVMLAHKTKMFSSSGSPGLPHLRATGPSGVRICQLLEQRRCP